MRSSILAAAAALVFTVNAQTFTDCNPTEKTCPSDPALGTTLTTDWTKGPDTNNWKEATGTKLKYGSNGAEFTINTKTDAPTIGTSKYIFFGKVEAKIKASPGTGIVSSFILESDDLDEVDWEWLGSDDFHVQSNFFGKGNTTTYDRSATHAVTDPIGTWNTYTIEWTSEFIKWSINNNLVRTLNYGDAVALGGKNFPQTPMKVKMGNWIGCLDASDPKTTGTCQWAGGQVDISKAPFTMYVQYVTIQDYSCASSYSYGDMTGSYQSIKKEGSCNGTDTSSSTSGSATSSAASSSTKSSTSTSSTGAILIESSTSGSAVSTSSAKSTGSGSGSAATTMSTATTTGTSSGSSTSGSSTSSSKPAQVTTNAAASTKTKYGILDFSVIALGLGLGYLVM